MKPLRKIANALLTKVFSLYRSALLSRPRIVECNICGWEGRYFASDSWHKHVICPRCSSDVRQRLFFAALQNMGGFSIESLINKKSVLHFAPEEIVKSNISRRAGRYVTADFLRDDCDLKLNLSSMPELEGESFDVVIAFDVLEHVPDFSSALAEMQRVLTCDGCAILTVPQKDRLSHTYEDPSIVTAAQRKEFFGQWDHLRIFGDDFSEIVQSKGFAVVAVDESMFTEQMARKNVLSPPVTSAHPLATNHRKVFFCRKSPR